MKKPTALRSFLAFPFKALATATITIGVIALFFSAIIKGRTLEQIGDDLDSLSDALDYTKRIKSIKANSNEKHNS